MHIYILFPNDYFQYIANFFAFQMVLVSINNFLIIVNDWKIKRFEQDHYTKWILWSERRWSPILLTIFITTFVQFSNPQKLFKNINTKTTTNNYNHNNNKDKQLYQQQ